MHRYQNNAFRLLGVLPNASTSDIMRRANEIKVKLSIGADVMYEYDFPWMGILLRNEQNLINAAQRLEDPVARIQEELSWFWVYSERDQQAINFLSQQKRQSAHDTWQCE